MFFVHQNLREEDSVQCNTCPIRPKNMKVKANFLDGCGNAHQRTSQIHRRCGNRLCAGLFVYIIFSYLRPSRSNQHNWIVHHENVVGVWCQDYVVVVGCGVK